MLSILAFLFLFLCDTWQNCRGRELGSRVRALLLSPAAAFLLERVVKDYKHGHKKMAVQLFGKNIVTPFFGYVKANKAKFEKKDDGLHGTTQN